jgi:7-cyano-7-deazaguanine synthase
LTGSSPFPVNRNLEDESEIPSTYVPARNSIFLSLALAYAEHVGAFDIFIGANAVDYSGYPDCRPEYIQAFERLANLATKAGVSGQKITIHAPLINLTKVQIIQLGLKLGVDYALTWSCYNPQPERRACGICDSCQIRRKAFLSTGTKDPLPYADD